MEEKLALGFQDNNGWSPWVDGTDLPPRKSVAGRFIARTCRGMTMLEIKEWLYKFWKRNMIAILVLAAFVLEGWVVAAVTEKRVTKEVTAEVETRMRAGFSQYLRDQEYQASAEQFLAGDASFEAALDLDSEWGAKLIYGYLTNGNISRTQAKAIICCAEARTISGYDSSFEAAVRRDKQWQWYSDSNPVREEDKELVKSVLRDLRSGRYPNGFTDAFIFMEWTPGDIVLRDKWEKDSKTHYWRFPE